MGDNYLDVAEEGGVLVIDNGGRLDCTVVGDILANGCKQSGIGGTVIYG